MARDSFRQPHYLRISIRRAFGIADIFKKSIGHAQNTSIRPGRSFRKSALFSIARRVVRLSYGDPLFVFMVSP